MKKNNLSKVFVGISGGVDSAASAILLKEQGYEVVGAHMKLWKEKGSPLEAKAKEEEKNARHIAEDLGIDFVTMDLRKEFKEEVVNYFLEEYARGLTPNPCVRCNREIKFG
ncbi:MAG: 7-cyano-7-deazaguanine synthase, partial [Candidatus Paceibacterota bacterium]